jgi:hypothetical protein
MADRKRVKEQAIAESVELSKPPVSKPKAKTPAEKLKSFSLNAREKAEAKAPLHPRAGKGQQVRTKALAAGMLAGREQEQKRVTASKARTTEGGGVIAHDSKLVPGFKSPNKKVNTRQVKKGKRQVIQSGKVVMDTDYGQFGPVKSYKEVTAKNATYSKMTPEERESAKAEAERKFLGYKKSKSTPTPKAKKPKKKSPVSLKYKGE